MPTYEFKDEHDRLGQRSGMTPDEVNPDRPGAFLAFGALLVIGGWLLARSDESRYW